jgi:Icc-related predicted phosphoesterase
MKIVPGIIVCLALLFASVQVGASTNDTLIKTGALWKYLDDGSNQGTLWTLPTFNDSLWPSDTAELGYGDGDENSVVSFGPDPNNKYITTYFRHIFNVTNQNLYRSLRIFLKRDDGAIVYLNGIEVYRSNMPDEPITHSTHAMHSVYAAAEKEFFPVAISKLPLVNGNNVIAVEIHQNDPDGGDLTFDMALIADEYAELVRGPYLQMAEPTSMTVCWRTSVPDVSKVLFGTSLAYGDSVIHPSLKKDHTLKINGLLPETKYYYAICSTGGIIQADSSTYFYTAPTPGSGKPVRIWTMGDMGIGTYQQKETRDAYYNYTDSTYTNIVLFLGDNAYSRGSDEQYTTKIFTNNYEEIFKKSAVYSTCGNHDYLNATASNQTGTYYDIFTFPKHGEGGGYPSGNEAYYSFNYSNIHFVCLESNIDSFGTSNVDSMLLWLETDLLLNREPWVIVYFHFPPYSKGYHNSDVNSTEIFCRENYNPILEKYNVDLVLSGHSHDYERSHLLKGHYGYSASLDSTMIIDASGGAMTFYDKRTPLDSGTVYAVVGSAAEVTPVQPDWPHPAMYEAFDQTHGTMVIDVNYDTMDVKFVSSTGSIDDQFKIVKVLPPKNDTLIIRGPYLQLATSSSMTVCWRTSINEASKVYYGTTLAYSDSVVLQNSTLDHFVKISGLIPNTKYFYSIKQSNGEMAGDSGTFFYTAPMEGARVPFRIWSMGDFGTGNPQQYVTRDAYQYYSGDKYTNILLWLGNNAGNSGSDYAYSTNVFNGMYDEQLKKSVVYSTCGNNDLTHANAHNQLGTYYNIFHHPANGEAGGYSSGNEAYYSFNYANVHFICLETNLPEFGSSNFVNMISWLYADLSNNLQPWVVVYFHYPPYTMGFYDSDHDLTMTSVRSNLIPILEYYNVDLVLSSHSRDYERSHLIKGHYGLSSTFFPPIMVLNSGIGTSPVYYSKRQTLNRGTIYVVAGSAGGVKPVQHSWPHPAMHTSLDSTFGSLVIDFNLDTLDVKFLASSGNIEDHFAIIKDSTFTATSFVNKKSNDVLIFPDPVTSELYTQFLGDVSEDIIITLYNNMGKLIDVQSERILNSSILKTDVSGLQNGVYFLKVEGKSINCVKKFIKL